MTNGTGIRPKEWGPEELAAIKADAQARIRKRNEKKFATNAAFIFMIGLIIFLFVHHHIRSQEVRHLENIVKIDNQIINLLEKQIHEQRH